MTSRAVLMSKIEPLPESRVVEALDFVEYLKRESAPYVPETMLLSEAALAKDWDTPEEYGSSPYNQTLRRSTPHGLMF